MREPFGPFLSHHLITDGTFLWILLAPLVALGRCAAEEVAVPGASPCCAVALPLLAGANLAGAALLAVLVAITFTAAPDDGRRPSA